MNKVCQKCKVDKDISHYYKQTSAADGLQHWCKDCMNANNKANKDKRLVEGYSMIRDAKVCADCNTRKPINQFHVKRGYSADGYGSYCRECWLKRTVASQKRAKAKLLNK